jgi:hypothetical protein
MASLETALAFDHVLGPQAYRRGDRLRCDADPEGEREKSRRYDEANRALVVARAVARRRAA